MKHELHFTYQNVPHTTIPLSLGHYTNYLKEIAFAPVGHYANHEHSICLPKDTKMVAGVTRMVKKYWSTQLKYIIVVGIGGSNLGTKAVYDALRGTMDGTTKVSPKILFLDTVSPRILKDTLQFLKTSVQYPEEMMINLISKSGGTTESIANFEILFKSLSENFSHLPKKELLARVVVTTDEDSPLWMAAKKLHIDTLAIPKEIGGRFSIFTPVGLFPLALAGIDIASMLHGARDVLVNCFDKENHALRLAEAVYRANKNGSNILNFFFFNPEFESLGKWVRQLYAESLGKEKDKRGHIIHAGITPIVSIGSIDLHSMAQLYLGGPRDKFTIFLYTKEHGGLAVPTDGLFTKIVPGLDDKTPEQIMSAIYDGVVHAYRLHKLPFGEMKLPDNSSYSLGMFLQWHMLTVMYLGELYGINTFDQPNVEDYKQVTRRILAEEK